MSDQFFCEIISKGYNEALRDFLDEDEPHFGLMHLKLSYGSDIWQTIGVHGRENQVLIIYDKLDEKIAATMICSTNSSYFHGKLVKSLYVSGLKIGTSYQKSSIIKRLLSTFKLYWNNTDVDLILFSVFSSNTTGLNIFSKKSDLLPLTFITGELNTYVFKKKKLLCKRDPTLKISLATSNDAEEIVQFIGLEGLTRSNLTNYTREELISGSGILEGFNLNNLAIARKESHIIGIMGLWNQTNYRQWIVKSYSSIIGFLRPLINIMATILGYPSLPAVNSSFSYKMLSLIICKKNSTSTFQHLFNHLMDNDPDDTVNYGITILSGDPLCKLFKPRSVVFSSIFYKAAYPEHLDKMNMLNFNNLYVEQARL